MEKTKIRTYELDGDSLEVTYRYDEDVGMYLGDYPDFAEEPRYTPDGKPWVTVFKEGCPYADKEFNDCGSCSFLEREQPGDLIGICNHKDCRRTD